MRLLAMKTLLLGVPFDTVMKIHSFCERTGRPPAIAKELAPALAKLLEEPKGVELWFGGETGIEGDPRPRRRWARAGTKPRVTNTGNHLRMNVCGLLGLRTGPAYLLEFTHSDREVFQEFLDKANRDLSFE